MANAGQYVRGLVESEQNNGRDPSALYTREELDKWMAGTEPGYKSYDYYDIVMRKMYLNGILTLMLQEELIKQITIFPYPRQVRML